MSRKVFSVMLVSILILAIVPSAGAATRPSTGFTGSWKGIDPGDGSDQALVIVGAKTTQIRYTDYNATSACAGASTQVFTAHLVGKVDGSEMHTMMTRAKCGTQPRSFLHGLEIHYSLDDGGNDDPADDILTNTDFPEEFFTRTS